MSRIWMPGGGGSGADLDVITADASDLLAGRVIVGPDGEPLAGTLALTGTAADSQVLAGKTYYNTDAKTKRTGTLPDQGAKNAALNCGGSYTIPAGYHNGAGKVTANSLASQTSTTKAPGAADVLTGRECWANGNKITGTMATQAGGTYKSTTANQTISCSGRKMTGNITITGDANLAARNIKKGVTILGITGTWEGFVAEPTDLYYNGVNSAGFSSSAETHPNWSSHAAGFQGTYIELGESITRLISGKAYNFAGYSKLELTFYFTKTQGSLGGATQIYLHKSGFPTYWGSEGEAGMLSISRDKIINGATVTVSFSLANLQTTYPAGFSFLIYTYGKLAQIKRIRLVK